MGPPDHRPDADVPLRRVGRDVGPIWGRRPRDRLEADAVQLAGRGQGLGDDHQDTGLGRTSEPFGGPGQAQQESLPGVVITDAEGDQEIAGVECQGQLGRLDRRGESRAVGAACSHSRASWRPSPTAGKQAEACAPRRRGSRQAAPRRRRLTAPARRRGSPLRTSPARGPGRPQRGRRAYPRRGTSQSVGGWRGSRRGGSRRP